MQQDLAQLLQNRRIHLTRVKDLAVIFGTVDPHSQGWFYPRYGEGRIHEPVVSHALVERLGPDKVFVDVGAHLGYFTCLGAATGATVFALEMQRTLLPLIEANARINGQANVHVINAAVSDRLGFMAYHRRGSCPGKRGHELSDQEECSREGMTFINTVTLDSLFLNEIRPHVLKIDVEGFESKVLAGAQGLLAKVGPVLFLELHPAKITQYGFSLEQVWDLLAQAGYTVSILRHRKQDEQPRALDRSEFLAVKGNPMAVCVRP